MKSFMKKVDLFCYRHPRFGIPNLMIYIVIGNVAVWLFYMMDTTGQLLSFLSLSPSLILRGQIWRLVTFVFIPNSTGFWALISFYFYYFIGSTIEREWGSGKFTIYILMGMLLTIGYSFAVYLIYHVNPPFVSAYYIYMSMFLTFATLYPDMQVLLFFILPIKMKWLGIIDAIYFAGIVLSRWAAFPLNLLPVVAIINYLLFCGGYLLDYFAPVRAQQRKNAVNFKSEVRRIRYEQAHRAYTRKCSVCGRTDTGYPDLEFRYCSRCAGYHCFCIDHINNHVHFTE